MRQTEPSLSVQAPAPEELVAGMKLGDYVVESAVAAGGMGIVYKARHPLLGRSVAIKVLRPEHARDDEQVSRFLKEAQAISAIRHRGIIDVHNFGHLPDGRQYMVMEFLEGETLEAVLQRDAPIPAARALPLLDEVLDALSAAHKVGVVHRDLKPSNVFLTMESNGKRYVKLVDFGLAKQGAPLTGDEAQVFAKASLVAGTPEYISPEQARGLQATPRTDLYCLGVMVFEMLAGKLPFQAPSVMELLRKHVHEPAPRVSALVDGIPAELDDLVAQLLEKEPDKRPSSADAVRQVVARLTKQLRQESTTQTRRPMALDRPAGGLGSTQPLPVDDAGGTAPTFVRPGPTTDVLPAKLTRVVESQPKLERQGPRWWPLALMAALTAVAWLVFAARGAQDPVTLGGPVARIERRAVPVGQQAGVAPLPPVVTAEPVEDLALPLADPAPEVRPVAPGAGTAGEGTQEAGQSPRAATPPAVPGAAGRPTEGAKARAAGERVAAGPGAGGQAQGAPEAPKAVAQRVEIVARTCAPTAEWKVRAQSELRAMATAAAPREDLAQWLDGRESQLRGRIDAATTPAECGDLETALDEIRVKLRVP